MDKRRFRAGLYWPLLHLAVLVTLLLAVVILRRLDFHAAIWLCDGVTPYWTGHGYDCPVGRR